MFKNVFSDVIGSEKYILCHTIFLEYLLPTFAKLPILYGSYLRNYKNNRFVESTNTLKREAHAFFSCVIHCKLFIHRNIWDLESILFNLIKSLYRRNYLNAHCFAFQVL